jgi:branched-chain amino acid transport system ATP-binding protein
MARGRLIASGDAKTICEDPLVRQVYFGSGRTFERAGTAS